MFKTPSPSMLGHRRIPGNTPPHLQFGGLNRPASLREEGDAAPDAEQAIEPPSLLDLLQADHDRIDVYQEVEYAGTSATEFGKLGSFEGIVTDTDRLHTVEEYEPDFYMPRYADLNLRDAYFFPCYKARAAKPIDHHLDEQVELGEMYELPQLTLSEMEPPLFPREAALLQLKRRQAFGTVPSVSKFATATRSNLSTSGSIARQNGALPSAQTSSLASRNQPGSAAPTSRIHSRASSTASTAAAKTSLRPSAKRTPAASTNLNIPVEDLDLHCP